VEAGRPAEMEAAMSRKDNKYFDSFVEMVGHSCEAAQLLRKVFYDFKPEGLSECMKEMHDIEHSGDIARHVMTKKLAKEFITPIEREDIMDMSEAIDTVTDKIEDVLIRIYIFNIQEIREDAKRLADVIVKCCGALKSALQEFHNFRKSKILHEKIILINQLEEEADQIYTEGVRNIYTEKTDPMVTQAWYETFQYLEDCCDACEDVADVVESVMMKNS
jgi:predicted phosphate transport protein (TIGR00153 family)